MKMQLSLALILFATVCIPAGAQLQFLTDGSEQSTAGITFDRVKVVHSNAGSNNANGTALRVALAAQASSQTTDVLLLEPGFYDIGSIPLAMVEGVNIQGLAANKTFIVDSGSVVANGAGFLEIHSVSIHGSGDGSTVVLQSSGEMDLIDTNIQHNGTGTGANYGVRAINGGRVTIIDSEIVFYSSGNSGSFTGFLIAGDDGGGGFSEGDMTDSRIEAEDDSGTMTLIALKLGDGTTTPSGGESVSMEIFGGIIFAEGGSSATAISVDSDKALENEGTGGAINTIFRGIRTGTTLYSRCTSVNGGSPTPITDSNPTSIP